MPKHEIIDCHAHTFPVATRGIAFQRALGIGQPTRDGTIEELLQIMDQAGIIKTNMLMWTPAWYMFQELQQRLPTDPVARSQEEQALRGTMLQRCLDNNEWAIEVVNRHPDRLTCFVGIDPEFMNRETMLREIDDKLARGAKGIKMAPVHFYPNDERLFPVYHAAQRWRVPLLSYASGSAPGHTENRQHMGHPRHFEEVLRAFPDCIIILSHLGIGAEMEVARMTNTYPNLYSDVSAHLHQIGKPGEWSPEEAVRWFRHIGIDHVLFGTNYPMCDPAEYVEAMNTIPLTETERAKVLSENFRRLVDLK